MALDTNRSQWDDDERDVLRENTAQAIHEQLETQDNLKPKYERRWIWELFQNALDAAGSSSEVRIRLEFGDSFTFAHNGAPFTRKEILHLIFHGSTKRESGNAIGRYGTGFLTTHVVSRKVHVRGQLDSGADFEFWLDRSGPTPSDLTRQMAASRQQLLDSLLVRTEESTRWTEFAYPVNAEASMVARAISDLSRIAIPVIAFNRKIRAIELGGRCQERYELLAEDQIDVNCRLLKVGNPDNEEKNFHLAVVADAEVAIAVPLQFANSVYSVISPSDVPRLFVAFPLFGTESIPFPFLMNSLEAIPTVNRDGLFLGGEDREDNVKNKSLVEKSWQLYKYVLDLSASQRWTDVHRLGATRPSPQFDWLDSEWLDSVLRTSIKNIVAQGKIVTTSTDAIVSPSEALFPIGLTEQQFAELHSLTQFLYGELVVRSDCAWQWYENLLGWHQLEADVSLSEVSLQTLSSKIVQIADVKTLAEALASSYDPFSWLNRLLLLLIQCKANWNNLPLLPNQLEKFSTLLQLYRDDGIDPQLKDIADLLLEGIRAQLIDTRVAPEIQQLKAPLDQEKVVGVLLGAVRARKSAVPAVAYATANANLLKWLIAKQRAADLKTYTFMARASDDHGANMLVTASAELLAPPEVWAETARSFVDLFPPDHVISSAYTETLNSEDWMYLSSLGICWLDPVFRTTRALDPDEVSTMVQEVQALETAEHTLAATEVAEVAFLSKEKGILDTARSSKSKGTLLLQFLFDHVIPLSPADLEYRAVACSCGKSHAAHSAAWLVPIKSRKWVYESKGHPAYISAVTLSRLIKDDASLMNRLAEDAIFTFLARLDVSPSELRRAALDLSEPEMAKLERAVLGVLSATDNNPQRLEQIAELVSSAPELLAEFEKKKKAKERVHRNQQLGSLVEQLFDELFRSDEIKAMGLRLRREPIGSDFAVENDFISGGQENLFGVTGADKDLLIELKSTLGDTATMTHTQASVAAGRSDSFALCVVPLEDRQPTVDIVRNQSRFVPSIGQRLRQKVDEVRAIRNLQDLTVQPTDGVQVVVEQGEFRYRVSESVWTPELSFEDFKQFLLHFFEKTVVV